MGVMGDLGIVHSDKIYYLPQFDSNILQLGEDIELWVILEVCIK